jgi:hypothetical protein
MYAETSETTSHARIAFALLCGLAVCCSVMYVTADGGDEYMHEIVAGVDAGTSVGSTDVLKAGQIYSETPDGRMRLMDYFNNVEKEISDEVSTRKSDIASVRAQMARDFAFNAAARTALKKQMLHQMAVNAKIARDHLNHNMRRTQEKFAKAAHLANRRHARNQARHRATMKLIGEDKARAAHALKLSTSAWQKATSAWASATNAKIDQLNKHAAANAAQIEENAKKARKDLDRTMNKWDTAVSTFRTDESKKNSRLKAQFEAQGKAQRAYASNKVKGYVAQTAAQFNDVSLKMAKNRHEVDMALRQASVRFEAALNAQKALEDHRYAQTVANIAGARAEAKKKVADATTEFKVGLLQLGSTVKEQVAKVNNAIDSTAGVVRSNAAAQAKVNANVNAEMTRMVKLGNKRYREHLKADAELEAVIAKDNEQTNDDLNAMALSFNAKLGEIRNQLAADRKHAETKLTASTTALYATLKKNEDEQAAKNADMEAATRRMRLDAMDNVRKTKEEFRGKIADLGKVVSENDEKADKQIKDLTGIVDANAEKSRKGRAALKSLEEANKNELKAAIRDAIDQGEKRAQEVEAKGKKMDADMQFLVNSKLTSEISKLRAETTDSVDKLAQMNEDARAQLKREMIFAVESAAKVAKADLETAMKDVAGKMAAFSEKAAASHANSALERKALADSIAANAKEVSTMLKDSVATAARAMTSLEQETSKKIADTNTQLDAYAKQMEEQAEKTRAAIKALTTKTEGEIKAESERAAAATAEFTKADEARQADARKFLEEQMAAAAKESEEKFGKAIATMAKDRADADLALGSAFNQLNDDLAKQAALSDSRFKNTVKDIDAAKAEATAAVTQLRKDFGTRLIEVNSLVKNIESRLSSNIAKVSGEVAEEKALQARVNERTVAELDRIEKLANKRNADDVRARGALRQVMDENKAAAQEEVKALKTKLMAGIDELRSKNAANRREMASDLSKATEEFSGKLAAQKKAQDAAHASLTSSIGAATAKSASELKAAQEMFDSKITMLTNTVVANHKHAQAGIEKLTGVVADTKKANAADRELIRAETKAAEADLQKALDRAISIGEARAKATEQRIAEHLKNTKRYLQVELIEQAEKAADNVFNILQGKRQFIADNYLSLKAYSIAAADKIQDYRESGKGLALSSIGDLLVTVGALGAVKAPAAEGLGMGGDTIPAIFSGKSVKVSGAVAEINGLVNEFTTSSKQVRERWPLGLGKYLLDKLEVSMSAKGVLQVDKVDGKNGNFVYINGRSVGLSNKLSDFSSLASKMSVYEAVLAKLTAKVKPAVPSKLKKLSVSPPEWQGN